MGGKKMNKGIICTLIGIGSIFICKESYSTTLYNDDNTVESIRTSQYSNRSDFSAYEDRANGKAGSIKTIFENAFSNCTKLSKITFTAVTSIRSNAFRNCPLQEVNLPNVTNIAQSAFSYDEGFGPTVLSKVILNSIPIINNAFSNYSSLQIVNLPKVEFVEPKAFSGCNSLQKVTFGSEGVTTVIKDSAFTGCNSLQYVNICGNTIVEQGAFVGCDSLKGVGFGGTNVICKPGAFSNASGIDAYISGELPGSGNMWKGWQWKSIKSYSNFASVFNN
jgi:hypothetical protein